MAGGCRSSVVSLQSSHLIEISDHSNQNFSLERSASFRHTASQRTARTHSRRRNMLTVGDRIPGFDVQAVVSTDMEKAFQRITDQSDAGKWKIVFFWPKDFTFVCPT